MSKAVKKIFKKAKEVVKKVGSFVKKNWKTIALVAAAVFTAGAALGYVGMGAAGGLTFGAGAGVGGMAGISTGYAALGNTVLGAVGGEAAFGGTVTGQSAGVMGLGTGGMTTASGISAQGIGAINAAGGATFTAGSGLSATAAGTTAAEQGANAALLTANNVTPAAAAGADANIVAQTAAAANAAPGAASIPSGAAPLLSTGEKLQLGAVALQGAQGYMAGKADDQSKEDALRAYHWNYGGPIGDNPDVAGMSAVRFVPGRGLLVPQQMQAQDRNVSMDDVVRAKYGRV